MLAVASMREKSRVPNTMDSVDPPDSLLSPAPSFTIRNLQEDHYLRSISNKEPSFSEIPASPPRLSSTFIPSHLYFSHPSTPCLSFANNRDQESPSDSVYRCISSVLKKDGQVLCVAVSNGVVYSGSQSNVIRVWKLPEFTECGLLKTRGSCVVVALHVSNDKVYAAFGDCKIRVWQRTWDGDIKHVRLMTIPHTGNYVRAYITGKDKMMKHAGPITCLAINVLDDLLYSASIDKTVKIWQISELKCIETIQAHQEPINSIIVADDGVLYTASDDATVRVWRRNFCSNDRRHSLTLTLPAKFSPVKALTLTSHGRILYGGCSDGYIHYWLKGWFSGQLQYDGTLQGHTHAVMCLANVGNYVVSGSADSTCRVWVRDPEDGQHKCMAVLRGHRGPIRCVAAFIGRAGTEEEVDEDGCSVCSGSVDGVVKIWRVRCKNDVARVSSQNNYEYFELP